MMINYKGTITSIKHDIVSTKLITEANQSRQRSDFLKEVQITLLRSRWLICYAICVTAWLIMWPLNVNQAKLGLGYVCIVPLLEIVSEWCSGLMDLVRILSFKPPCFEFVVKNIGCIKGQWYRIQNLIKWTALRQNVKHYEFPDNQCFLQKKFCICSEIPCYLVLNLHWKCHCSSTDRTCGFSM